MKLAAVQYRAPKGRPDRARAELAVLVADAGGRGADLVVLPEMATTGYIWESPAEIGPLAEPPRGPTFRVLSEAAASAGCWVVCGFPEAFEQVGGPQDQRWVALYNSAMVISPAGELVTCYRKVLLFDADETWANPGHRRVVVPADFGRIVPGICMDLNDPGFTGHLERVDPAVLAFCTNWLEEGLDVHAYWASRLGGWRGWTVAANTWGDDRGTRFCGRSAILGPGGVVVAQAGVEGDGILLVDTEA